MNIKDVLLELQMNPYLYQGQIKEKNITKKDISIFAEYFNLKFSIIKDKNKGACMVFLNHGKLMKLNDFNELKYKGKEISYNGISMISVFADDINDDIFQKLKHEDFPFDSLYKKIFARKILNKYEEEYNNGIRKSIEIITREIRIGEKNYGL